MILMILLLLKQKQVYQFQKLQIDGIANLSVKHTAVHLKFTLPTSGSFKPFARAGMMKGTFEAEDDR